MTPWDIDWVWSLPLIAVSVIVHVIGLHPDSARDEGNRSDADERFPFLALV